MSGSNWRWGRQPGARVEEEEDEQTGLETGSACVMAGVSLVAWGVPRRNSLYFAGEGQMLDESLTDPAGHGSGAGREQRWRCLRTPEERRELGREAIGCLASCVVWVQC